MDIIQLEQYMDFVRNRMFRQTLLCQQGVQLSRTANPDRVAELFVASPAVPQEPIADVRTLDRVLFTRPGSTLTTTEPLLKAAMLQLADSWPQSVSFKRLLAAARSRVHPDAIVVDKAAIDAEERKLTAPLLHCYATTHVDLSAGQFPFAQAIDDRPLASKLSRFQAMRAKPVTNLWHETVHLTDTQRRILPLLDGRHDREAIVEVLVRDVQQSQLVVQDKGELVTETEAVSRVVARLLDEDLGRLARNGLLLITP